MYRITVTEEPMGLTGAPLPKVEKGVDSAPRRNTSLRYYRKTLQGGG